MILWAVPFMLFQIGNVPSPSSPSREEEIEEDREEM